MTTDLATTAPSDVPADDPAVDLETRAVHTLRPHPRNSAIYGDGADADLVASVRQWGVLMPLLVTPDGLVISGHRRLDAARKAGRAEVPVLVHAVRDDVEVLALLLEANRQRQKTNEQIGREYEAAKEVEAVHAERRRLANLTQNQSVASSSESEVLTSTPRRDGTTGKARDRAAARVGVGWQKAERAAAVVQAIDSLQERGKVREATELRQTLNGASVQRAYEQAMEAGYVERPAARAKLRLSRRRSTSLDARRARGAAIDELLPYLRWAALEDLLAFALEERLSV